MSKTVKKLFLVLSMLFMSLSLGACGEKPMTRKEFVKIEERYEKGKISDDEYLEALDAYIRGKPAPKKGFFATVFGFIKNVVFLVFGIGVVLVVFAIFKKKK